MVLADFLPVMGAAGGSGGLSFVVTRWWAYRLSARKQSDGVALELVKTLQTRVAELEEIAHRLEHELKHTATEAEYLFWLLKFVPEERRQQAVEEVERARRERADRKGNARQAAQIAVSAVRVLGGEGE